MLLSFRGVALVAATAALSFAQTPQAAIPTAHVAIINLQKAVGETAEIRKAQATLQTKYKPRQDAIENLQRVLQDIQRQLGGPNLAPQTEAQLRQNGTEKQKQLQRMSEDLQSDVNSDRQEILGRAGRQMNEIIRKIAEQRGIDVVIDVTTTLYFKPALDITPEATAAYDKAYPVTTP
jgi:outer membrane protein